MQMLVNIWASTTVKSLFVGAYQVTCCLVSSYIKAMPVVQGLDVFVLNMLQLYSFGSYIKSSQCCG